MLVPFVGQCRCGAVQFRCESQPLSIYNCHCKGCRTIARADYMCLLVMQSDTVKIEGQLQKVLPHINGDRHGRRLSCRACGDVLFASSTMPAILMVNADRLAETGSFVAVADIWMADADPAPVMNTHIPKVWKSPPLIGHEIV